LEWCLFVFTVLCGLMALPNHLYPILLIVGLCVIVGGVAWPLCTGVISNMAPKKFQGKIMGMSQSIQSLAMTIAPVVGGMASHGEIKLPFVIAAFFGIAAMGIYFSFKRQVG
jgi:MFS family permease